MTEVLSAEYSEDMMPVIPPSPEVQATAADQATRTPAQLAIEEIMRTDPSAAFDWPTGSTPPSRGVTYTPPTGDA